MTNNYILKNILQTLGLNSKDALKIYNLADKEIALEDVDDVLREEDDPKFILLHDEGLTLFLDGLIIYKRGASDKKPSDKQPEDLTNNQILKKLRIAFNLRDEDMIKIFSLENIELTNSELTPYFRKKGHRNYKKCSDSLLKSFLKGYQAFLATIANQ